MGGYVMGVESDVMLLLVKGTMVVLVKYYKGHPIVKYLFELFMLRIDRTIFIKV